MNCIKVSIDQQTGRAIFFQHFVMKIYILIGFGSWRAAQGWPALGWGEQQIRQGRPWFIRLCAPLIDPACAIHHPKQRRGPFRVLRTAQE